MTTLTATAAAQAHPLPANLADMALTAVARHDGSAALRYKRDGRWVDLSYADFGARARAIAAGLIALGIESGDRVAILANTIPEWTIADVGILCAGAVVVPIYFTNSPRECLHVLVHSDARAVFCEDAAQHAKLAQIRTECPDLEHVIALCDEPLGEDALTLDELILRGSEVPAEDVAAVGGVPVAGDPATIVYTSGTTGDPKGCIITHGNALATIGMYEDQLHLANDEHPVVYMFLPLAHVLARTVELVTLQEGGTLAFWTRDPSHLLADLAEVRPTHFPSVPRVFEKVHTAALVGVEDGGALQQRVFRSALALGARRSRAASQGRRLGLVDRLRAPLAERLVFAKVHALFGGRLRKALTGAAPIGPDVIDFFDACGIPLLEGYGMTETCAAATLNTDEARRTGTVGRALPGVQLKIAADGEILMRGPNISPGYHRDRKATAELFDADGWLCSGDLGVIDDDGFLTITGRKKDLIITSSGKNIGPTTIETRLQETRWISHAVVYGDDRPYLVALLTIDAEEAPELARRAGIPDADPELLAANDAVHAVLQESVDEVGADFARIEQVKRFGVLDRDLLQSEGELTPTLKIRRATVYDRYRARFEALYEA
ncbi:MAG TPA: long-chain fatty acid--CoA ligase [Solirubrobacteraceae bacterium]